MIKPVLMEWVGPKTTQKLLIQLTIAYVVDTTFCTVKRVYEQLSVVHLLTFKYVLFSVDFSILSILKAVTNF